MKFTQEYSDDQENFRKQVRQKLEQLEAPEYKSVNSKIEYLGLQGWLVPASEIQNGGASLSEDRILILAEELDNVGLLQYVDSNISKIHEIISSDAHSEYSDDWVHSLAAGKFSAWTPLIHQNANPDPEEFTIVAHEDGDEYVLNGQGAFTGRGKTPGIIWTLARINLDQPLINNIIGLIVPGNQENLIVENINGPMGNIIHNVYYKNTRIPRSYVIGSNGDSFDFFQSIMNKPTEFDNGINNNRILNDLIEFATQVDSDQTRLIDDAVLQQSIMRIYALNHISKLFQSRDQWLSSSDENITYQRAQTRKWQKETALQLAKITRDIIGVYALLDENEPSVPANGRFLTQQMETILDPRIADAMESDSELIAREIGLLNIND